MRIYTRKTKPKLYVLLAVSIVFLIASIPLYYASSSAPGLYASYWALFFLTVLGFLIRALVAQMGYNPYSYNTIIYFGFALFLCSLALSQIFAAYRCFSASEAFFLKDAARVLLSGAQDYMRLSLPFLALFSLALILSNLVLIQKEGFRVPNALGILLALCLLGGEAILWFVPDREGLSGLFLGLFSILYLYVECMLIGTIFALFFAAKHRSAYDKEYLIILGCRVFSDASPSPILRARADAAIAFAEAQEAACGKRARFIASGGRGSDEPVSEARAIADYLVSRGIDPDRILLEERSTDTLENLRFSFALTNKKDPCAFSTSNYHVFRSGIAANRAIKHKAEGIGAPTKWYFWPNAAVREFIGLITGHRGKQLWILASLIAAYLAIRIAFFPLV